MKKKILILLAILAVFGGMRPAGAETRAKIVDFSKAKWKVYRNEKFHFQFREPVGLFGEENINGLPGWFTAASVLTDFSVIPQSQAVDRMGAKIRATSAALYAEAFINDAIKYDQDKNNQFIRAVIENIPFKGGEGLKLVIVYDYGPKPCVDEPGGIPCPSPVETFYIFYKAPFFYQFSLRVGADEKLMDTVASSFEFI